MRCEFRQAQSHLKCQILGSTDRSVKTLCWLWLTLPCGRDWRGLPREISIQKGVHTSAEFENRPGTQDCFYTTSVTLVSKAVCRIWLEWAWCCAAWKWMFCRGGQKYRYGNISQYFAAQYNIDFSTLNIDISLKSDSAVRRLYFCSRESGWGLCKMDGKLTTSPQFKVDIWKQFGFKVKRDSKDNELDKENFTARKFHGN